MADVFARIRKRLNLDSYVILYEDERTMHGCVALSWLGSDGLRKLDDELRGVSPEELQRCFEECSAELLEDDCAEELFPDSPERQPELRAQFEAQLPGKKIEAIKQAQYLYSFAIAFFL